MPKTVEECRKNPIPDPNKMNRTILYLNTVITVGSQSNSTITSPESSANQNRVLRHSRAPG